jgi:putative SOS response-associated peptidase YedK
LINARAESLPEKPSFRQAFKARRCLIPADGFYEWKATPAGKMPHRFTLREEQWFCFAGLWESWQPTPAAQRDLFANAQAGVPPIETYTIITTAANELVRPLHDRMPVILAPINYDRWLNPRTPPGELAWLLRPFPADQMACARASRRVNSPRVEGPECLSAE